MVPSKVCLNNLNSQSLASCRIPISSRTISDLLALQSIDLSQFNTISFNYSYSLANFAIYSWKICTNGTVIQCNSVRSAERANLVSSILTLCKLSREALSFTLSFKSVMMVPQLDTDLDNTMFRSISLLILSSTSF